MGAGRNRGFLLPFSEYSQFTQWVNVIWRSFLSLFVKLNMLQRVCPLYTLLSYRPSFFLVYLPKFSYTLNRDTETLLSFWHFFLLGFTKQMSHDTDSPQEMYSINLYFFVLLVTWAVKQWAHGRFRSLKLSVIYFLIYFVICLSHGLSVGERFQSLVSHRVASKLGCGGQSDRQCRSTTGI